MRTNFAIECFALLVVCSASNPAAAAVTPLPQTEVEQAVIDALPAWQGRKAQIIDYLDLTQPLATTTPWALVVAQGAGPIPAPEWTDHGPIAVCLMAKLHPMHPQCAAGTYWHNDEGFGWPYSLLAARVVYAARNDGQPLLLVQTCSVPGINGNCSIHTALYQYARDVDSFRRIFVNVNGGPNNNAATRFVEHGPLQGDVIIDTPTSHAPYKYWIEVFAPGKSGHYARVLRYRSITRYGDGNPLPVADSDMPEIMQRLGLGKPGDALPIPPHMPKGCGPLVMRHGEEWCKTLRIASTPQQ